MRVYLAAPLFSDEEREYNKRIADSIRSADFTVILPQEFDGNEESIYKQCLDTISHGTDVIVSLLNGADAESGTSFECGYGRAMGKTIIGIRTDMRGNHVDGLNIMLRFGIDYLVGSVEEAIDFLKQIHSINI